LPKDKTSELAGLFSTLYLKCWTSSREAAITNFGITRSTDYEADAIRPHASWRSLL